MSHFNDTRKRKRERREETTITTATTSLRNKKVKVFFILKPKRLETIVQTLKQLIHSGFRVETKTTTHIHKQKTIYTCECETETINKIACSR